MFDICYVEVSDVSILKCFDFFSDKVHVMLSAEVLFLFCISTCQVLFQKVVSSIAFMDGVSIESAFEFRVHIWKSVFSYCC